MANRLADPITGPLPCELLAELRVRGRIIDQPRLNRALYGDPNARPQPAPKLVGRGVVEPHAGGGWQAEINNYTVWINLAAPELAFCPCTDYVQWGKSYQPMPVLCKHILALAVDCNASYLASKGAPTIPTAPPIPQAKAGSAVPFGQQVRVLIGEAVKKHAATVQGLWQAGQIPLLLGPTDSAKSGTYKYLFSTLGMPFFPISGLESAADADLVGMLTVEGPLPKAIARACEAARKMLKLPEADRKPVGLLIDEVFRFNQRALDVFMEFLQEPLEAPLAKLMGIDMDGHPVRRVDVPVWPEECAPADLLWIGMAGNPWGTTPDPAFIRRVYPVAVDFDPNVLTPFDRTIRQAVQVTWESNKAGGLRLPLGYSTLVRAQGANDQAIFNEYLARLAVLDPTGPDGFRALLAQKGITL